MRPCFLLLCVGLWLTGSAAAGIVVEEDRERSYVKKTVRASAVKAVEIFLVGEVLVRDCNQQTLVSFGTRVFGDGSGVSDVYLVGTQMNQTEMFCPLEKPVKEMVRSLTLKLSPADGACRDNEVDVSLLVPAGFDLEVLPIKCPDADMLKVKNAPAVVGSES